MSVVIDLDNTLCDATHRVHHAQNKEWDEFHLACVHDKPNLDVVAFCRMITDCSEIVAVTGRNERYRNLTMAWLTEWDVPVDILLMRPDYDFSPDHLLKPRLLTDHYGSWELVLENVWFALDDRDKVIDAFRNNGLPCWQVRPGSF